MGSFAYGMLVEQIAITATAAGTTTLVNTSKQNQMFTGSAVQTIVLPDATTMIVGQSFNIFNQSSSALTVQFNGATAFTDASGKNYSTLSANTSLEITLQTNGTAAGTWAVIASSANGTGAVFQSITVQKFTAGGTYTPTTGMVYATVECVGGGGGGGATSTTNSTQVSCAGGGGGGEYVRKTFSASTIGSGQTITIGNTTGNTGGGGGSAGGINNGTAGSNTTFGSLITAHGGGGGTGSGGVSSTSFGVVVAGGAGGSGGSGDLDIPGQPGGFSNNITGNTFSGAGGNSYFGFGGAIATGNSSGNFGTGYGSGASGGSAGTSSSGAGGASAPTGICIITEYVN